MGAIERSQPTNVTSCHRVILRASVAVCFSSWQSHRIALHKTSLIVTMAVQFQCFCPASDSGCPKVTRQIGKYDSLEVARAAQLHHLMHSSYHWMPHDCAIDLVDAKETETINE